MTLLRDRSGAVCASIRQFVIKSCRLKNTDKLESFFPLTRDAQTFLFGEFDSGSERTLAAWIRHASRARFQVTSLRMSNLNDSGERVSNAWVICL